VKVTGGAELETVRDLRTGVGERGSDQATARWLTPVDAGVFALILGCGAMQFILYQRASDFFAGDATYFELARSIVRDGFYGFDFKPETMLPPGFPAILAVMCVTVGCTHAVLVRSMAVFSTSGFLVAYVLLRREQGRAVAAAVIALLLAASVEFFRASTTTVLSDLPYFFTSMAVLLLATHLDAASDVRRRAVLLPLCGLFLIASLLIRTSGIALLAGLLAWLGVSFLVDRATAVARLKTFVPLLLAGLVVQALWMGLRHKEVVEWPVAGYPRPYISQLSVKNGNQPELGAASLADVASRAERNLVDRAVAITYLLTGKFGRLPRNWFSPWVFGPVMLILVGLGGSMWRTGGQLHDWYFVGHEAMYLLWPWNYEERFFLPVAPLACLYLWRGGKAVLDWAVEKPRLATGLSLLIASVSGVWAIAYGWNTAGARSKVAAVSWVLFALSVAWIHWGLHRPSALNRLLSRLVTVRRRSVGPFQIAAFVMVAVLVGIGVARQLRMGRDNLAFDVTREDTYPQILAAKWIQLHTPGSSVVMARQLDVVFHYAERKVVWFPPSSDPRLLMDGIIKHRVEFIIVFDRGRNSYWLPSEQDCFKRLSAAYPWVFHVVQEGPREKIYSVMLAFEATERSGDSS
jgi:hypothetical protein